MDPHPSGLLQVIVAAGDTTTDRSTREGGDGWFLGGFWAGNRGVAAVVYFFNPSKDVHGGWVLREVVDGRSDMTGGEKMWRRSWMVEDGR